MNDPYLVRQHLKNLSGPLESYCTECGVCCHLSMGITHPTGKDRILIKDLPCRFLSNNKCTVYESRFEKAPWCQDLNSLLSSGLAPKECGYVKNTFWYKGVRVLPDDLIAYLMPKVIEHLMVDSAPFRKTDVDKFYEKWL